MDRKPVSVKSYANIAIVKYWGKKDAEKMIPSTSSISLTLENMYTETQLSPLPDSATGDEFYIDGQLQSPAEHAKISKIIDRFRSPEDGFVRVDTSNNMPTAAGLSSSSSGLSVCPSQGLQCLFSDGPSDARAGSAGQVCFRVVSSLFLWSASGLG